MTTTPDFTATAPRRQPIDRWALAVAAIAAVVAVPVLAVLATILVPSGAIWAHLASTVLPSYIRNSLILMVSVGAGVSVIGVATAWLVTMTRFPGVRVFEWALLLPFAIPAYVLAYTYTGLMDFAGPVQTSLRAWFGWGRRDYWFPEVRSLGGAIAMLTLVFYPYVYLLARAAFLEQSVCVLEVSRTLGRGAWRSFATVALPLARPSIAAGVALALMETLSDFGTVQYFGVDTFTTGIYRTWLGLGEPLAAAQLAAILLLFVFAMVAMERWSRGDRRYGHTSRYVRPLPRARLARRNSGVGISDLSRTDRVRLHHTGDRPGRLDHRELERRRWHALSRSRAPQPDPRGHRRRRSPSSCALVIAYGMRLSASRIATIASRIAAMGYAVPGSVIAVGVLLPCAWLDNRIDALMREIFGISTGLLLSGTVVAMTFAYLVRFLGAALNPVEASLGRVTANMDGAARTLGVGPAATLRRVHAPLISGGLLTAALLVFVDVMKELPATLIMRPFNFDTLAVRAYQLAADERLAEAAAPSLADRPCRPAAGDRLVARGRALAPRPDGGAIGRHPCRGISPHPWASPLRR